MSLVRKLLNCALAACFALPVLAADNMQPANEAKPTIEQLAANSAQSSENANPQKEVATAEQQPININTATAEQLTTIKGIGEKRAQAIIAFREQNGPFKSVEDLSSVKGISKKFIEKNRNQLTIS